MPERRMPRLTDFIGKCVVIQYVNGDTLTGFLQAVERNLLTVIAAGKVIFVPLYNVTEISRAEGSAC